MVETTTLEQFPLNTECVYIDSFKYNGTVLYKFGQSNHFGQRVKNHKKTYADFQLLGAFKVDNKIEIENVIKKD